MCIYLLIYETQKGEGEKERVREKATVGQRKSDGGKWGGKELEYHLGTCDAGI